MVRVKISPSGSKGLGNQNWRIMKLMKEIIEYMCFVKILSIVIYCRITQTLYHKTDNIANLKAISNKKHGSRLASVLFCVLFYLQ